MKPWRKLGELTTKDGDDDDNNNNNSYITTGVRERYNGNN